MIFTSLLYLAFMAACALTVALLPARARFGFCLLASYLFYASWNPAYLLLIFGVGAVGQVFGARAVRKAGSARSREAWIGVVLLLLALVVFRTPSMLNFIGAAGRSVLHLPPSPPSSASMIPLGLSFYIFEGISYLLECAKGREQAYGFWEYQLFISFFPHLVAGPIMRAKELIRQFRTDNPFNATRIGSGMWWICSGLFLKVVLADQLSPKLDAWYAVPTATLRAADVVLLAIGFGIQMYLDFAGYSRIAVGSARCLGIELVENFNHPFSAVSPADFWNRWHISLSRWVRDYVFFGVVGRHRGLGRLCTAAILSMVLCGLWHGFGVKFFIWGLFHGLVIAGYHLFRAARERIFGRAKSALPAWREKLVDFGGWATTLVVLLPGWVLFRAENLTIAGRMLRVLVTRRLLAGRSVEGHLYVHVALLFAAVVATPSFVRAGHVVLDRVGDAGSSTRMYVESIGRAVLIGATFVVTLIYLGTKLGFVYFQF